MINITLSGGDKINEIAKDYKDLINSSEQRAVARAVAAVRNNTIKLISATSSISKTKLEKGIIFHMKGDTGTEFVLSVSGKPVGAEYYGAKKVGNGMAWLEAGTTIMVPHAFTNPKLGNMVFIRKPGGGISGLVPRLPIARVYGSSVASLFMKYNTTIINEAGGVLKEKLLLELLAA